MPDAFDVIIIGTGAGGGTLAHTLAPSGKRILLLERGDFLPREMDNWNPDAVFIDGKYISADTWYDSTGAPFQPQVHYFVGGATKLYGAALYRLRPADFGDIHHVDGLSPAWPMGYDDFEPWYTKAEWLYQVHGSRDEDPTEGHWSKPYPWPSVSHEPRLQEIADALKAAGYHPFSAPVGIMLDEVDRARSACIRCAWCDGYPCLVHAKADAEVIGVRPVLDCPNVTLLVNAEVVKLETDPAGRAVTGVVVERDGNREVYSADVVAVCAGASNSAKILLSSANDRHPNGLANGSDQVGRNYMFHNCKAVAALGKEANETVFQKTLGINDFYSAGPDRPWPLGNIQMIGKSNAGAMKGEEPKLTMLAPRWSLQDVAGHSVDWWLTTEDLPKAENRVTVDGDGRVHLDYASTNDKEADGLYEELKTILNHTGMAQHHVFDKNFYMAMNVPVAGVAHQAGTCRFGTDPATSVLDVNCKAHEVDNLYVVDTSFFPSIGAVNPALTAIANAMRVGEHLVERLGVNDAAGARHRVVIVGGGFGGLPTARFLGRRRVARTGVEVTLVDRRNHHLFQPLLYQVATGLIPPGQISPALRHVVRKHKNVRVELAEVTGFDLDRRVVHVSIFGIETREIPYDSLIVAAGVNQSYFGHNEYALYAPGMKTIDDAMELRRRFFGAFEMAEMAEDQTERERWLTVAIVGAGPTGVELAGQVRELAVRSLRGEFRSFDASSVRVVLLDGGKEPLATFGDQLSGKAAKELQHLGVELRMGARVVGIDATGVDITDVSGNASRLDTYTTVWAAGVQASPLAAELAKATGAELDRAGRIAVLPDLTLPGHPEVFVVGDMMALDNLPGVAEVAMQGGLHAANTIVRRLKDEPGLPFKYRDLGSAAAIGRFRSVVDFKGIRLSGFPGWVVWAFVHLAFLTGFGNRLTTLLKWTRSFIGRGRPEREFSVLHTGGDLSLPEEVRAAVQPNPLPVYRQLQAQAADAPPPPSDPDIAASG